MSVDTLIILGVAAALLLVVMLPFYVSQRRREKRTDEAEATARRYGLHEPVSLHPVVSAEACILCKQCLRITGCPALSLGDKTIVIDPDLCNGCGLCVSFCPTGALVKEGA